MYIKGKKAHNLVDNPIEQYKSSSAHLTYSSLVLAFAGLHAYATHPHTPLYSHPCQPCIALTPNAGEDRCMYLWKEEVYFGLRRFTIYTEGNEHLNNMKLFIKPGITPRFVSSHF